MGKRILFVSDLPLDTKARELAREFERYGPIVRCDVPFPKREARTAYAFVEYEDSRDADDAYRRLHGKPYRGGTIRIEWAKRGPEPRRDRRSGRSRSPRRGATDSKARDARSPSRSVSRSRSPVRSRSPGSVSSSRKARSPRNRSLSPVRSPKMSDHDI